MFSALRCSVIVRASASLSSVNAGLGNCRSTDNKGHSVFNTLFLAIESIKFSIWFSAVIYLEI